jgi:hypothetical protein
VADRRKLAILRAHGLIKKIPRTHRYLLTAEGRVVGRAPSLAAPPHGRVKCAQENTKPADD